MTNNLKREIKPIENQFEQIRVRRTTGIETIDATKTLTDYERELDDLRARFPEQFVEMAIAADERASLREQREEAAREKHIAEEAAVRDSQHQPLENYARVFKSRDPTALTGFFETAKTDDLNNIAKQLSAKPRFYNSIFGYEIVRAIQDLKNEIAARPPESAPSLFSKLRERIGVH